MGGWSVNRKQHSQNRKSAKSAQGEKENKKRLERLVEIEVRNKYQEQQRKGVIH